MSPILSLILNKLQEQTIISPFVIVHGPWVDVQWSAIRESCQTATGFFAYHDVLEIKDYSELLGKPHTLKVEFKKMTILISSINKNDMKIKVPEKSMTGWVMHLAVKWKSSWSSISIERPSVPRTPYSSLSKNHCLIVWSSPRRPIRIWSYRRSCLVHCWFIVMQTILRWL